MKNKDTVLPEDMPEDMPEDLKQFILQHRLCDKADIIKFYNDKSGNNNCEFFD